MRKTSQGFKKVLKSNGNIHFLNRVKLSAFMLLICLTKTENKTIDYQIPQTYSPKP